MYISRISGEELAPVREDYATAHISEGFNWEDHFVHESEVDLYLVVFRSVRRVGADLEKLKRYDEAAHREASESAGFRYYFKGQVNGGRECLSFCLWESRNLARKAARGVFHNIAVGVTEEMYETYDLERYSVRCRDGCLTFTSLTQQ